MDSKKFLTYVGVPAAVVATATAWNLLMVPFLNSDFSPVAGTIRVKAIESIQQETVKSLDKTNMTVDGVVKQIDRTACSDWNRRLRVAEDALKKNSFDVVATELRRQALDQIFSLGECMIEPLP